MGIEEFQRIRDYAKFAVMMAFLEGKMIDQQFLLSELCEEIEAMWPGEAVPDWTKYEERKGLVRVVQYAVSQGIIQVVDGDTGAFPFNQEEDVLYEGTLISRYFLRTYPEDLFAYEGLDDLLEREEANTVRSATEQRRHRVYRKLLFSPVMKREDNEEDFLYVRNYRNTIQTDIEKMTNLKLEVYKNTAMVTAPERLAILTVFPDKKVVSDLVIQWATMLREDVDEEVIVPDLFGNITLSEGDRERLLKRAKEQFGNGWSKQYKTASLGETRKEVDRMLCHWQLGEMKEDGFLKVNAAIGRLIGHFPADFLQKEED